MLRFLLIISIFLLHSCIDPIPLSEFSRDQPDKINVYGLLDDQGNSTVWFSRCTHQAPKEYRIQK